MSRALWVACAAVLTVAVLKGCWALGHLLFPLPGAGEFHW